jgi:hypothetical protein
MKDEEYLFISDARDKKNIARSARNQRTHNGKRGRVKLPSDYLTKKELKAMNGTVESYKLNDPMVWVDFKRMPDDLKITYIKLIRERYNVPDFEIAIMLGVHRVTFSQEMNRLNIGLGKSAGGTKEWDKEGWMKWCNPNTDFCKIVSEEKDEEPFCDEKECDECKSVASEAVCEVERAIPTSGELVFDGNAETSLRTVLSVLGGANVHMRITWEMLDE